MSYELDTGLIIAAERAAQASHGIKALLAEYKWWANFANQNPQIKEAMVSADSRASKLRMVLAGETLLYGGQK